jgi:pimeloyl-ACP methyl ester carboxylesterase
VTGGPYSRWSARYCYDTPRRLAYPSVGGLITVKIQVTNATIALDEVGEGTPVLLLHGFPATRHLWSHVVPLLGNSGYRLLVPDLVGYGESEAPAGWGERDEFLSIDAVGRPLAELLGARLVRLPGAHFTPLDCPAEVAMELHDFLRG